MSTTIIVHNDQTLGAIKPMHAVNNGPIIQRADQSRGNSIAYAAAKIPFARNHDAAFYNAYGGEHSVDVNNIFPNFDADPDDPASYDFVLTDHYIEETASVGTETFYRLGAKIEHMIKKYNTLPPKDFHKWAVVCEHIIRHMNEGWADGHRYGIRYWEIWNEPDLDDDDALNKRTWGGTKAQFFDLYEITAKHLKKCFPDLKIGGPALAYREDWANDFLHEMAKRNVPMDFFSWHIYSTLPSSIIAKGDRLHAMMEDAGYGDAESICNEWNYVKGWSDEFVYSIQQIIGMKGAAFTADTMARGQDSSIDMLMYYDARPCAFNGMFDFYDYHPLKGYYPFLIWGKLADLGTQVKVENDAANVRAIAATNGKGGRGLLITRYEESDALSATETVTVNLKGLEDEIYRVHAYMTDKDRTMEHYNLSCHEKTFSIDLLPNSFVYIEY